MNFAQNKNLGQIFAQIFDQIFAQTLDEIFAQIFD